MEKERERERAGLLFSTRRAAPFPERFRLYSSSRNAPCRVESASVCGPFSPPIPLIRADLLRTTRETAEAKAERRKKAKQKKNKNEEDAVPLSSGVGRAHRCNRVCACVMLKPPSDRLRYASKRARASATIYDIQRSLSYVVGHWVGCNLCPKICRCTMRVRAQARWLNRIESTILSVSPHSMNSDGSRL